jgi:hypothetical protein
MQPIDELANVIANLSPFDQGTLLDKVAQLNFQKGLHDLAEQYRARLARENQLTSSPEQIWTELHFIREKIAQHDYPT